MKATTLRDFSTLVLTLNDPSLPEGQLFDQLTKGMTKLVPHNSIWATCSDLQSGQITSYLGPWAQQAVDLFPAFSTHAHEHPQFMALVQGKAALVDSVSDYVGRRAWRSTDMYREVVSKTDSEDQLSTSQKLSGHLSFSLVVNRDGWGFSGQERAVLELLAPHAIQAWRTRWLLRQSMADGATEASATHATGRFRVMVDSMGNLVDAAGSAVQWLRQTFGGQGKLDMLPETLCEWLRRTLRSWHEETESMERCALGCQFTMADGSTVRAHLSPGPPYGVHAVMVEQVVAPVAAAVARLVGLRLSERQAEVLYWLSEGKSNDEIAGILSISLYTVKAHVRAIFSILSVENRHAAAAVAWQMARVPRAPWQCQSG